MAGTQAPPAPPEAATQAAPTPVFNWPQPAPAPAPADTAPNTSEKTTTKPTRKSRGVPMAPVLTAGTSTTTLLLTSVYQAGGIPALVGAGAAVVGGAGAGVVRRRATVKRRNLAASAGRASNGMPGRAPGRAGKPGAGQGSAAGSAWRGAGSRPGAASGSRLGGAAGAGRPSGARASFPASGSASGRRATGAPGTGHTQRPGNTRRLSGKGAGQGMPGRPGAASGQAGRRGILGRVADRMRGGDGKTTTPKTDQKADTRRSLARRAASRAWAATADPRRKTKAAAGRTARRAATATHALAKKARGAAWDGIVAMLAAAGTGLWRRSKTAAAERLRAVWARRRAKRNQDNTPAPAAPPAVGATIRRPASTTTASSTFGGTTAMSGHHFTGPAMEMARAASAYHPAGMLHVGHDFSKLPEALEMVAQAMRISTEQADASFPLDPRIVEVMRSIFMLQMQAAEAARELGPAFQKLHHVDLQRLENPRKGTEAEAMWDVRSNL